MYDLVRMPRSAEAEAFAKRLGFERVFFLDDLKKVRIVEGISDSVNREVVEKKRAQILLNPHQERTKDALHFRNSGLNHVLCTFAHANNVAIAFSLDQVQTPEQMGRVMQNIMLCRKYKVQMLFFTNAKTLYEMRGAQDLLALCRVLGMTPGEAKDALTGLGSVAEKKE